MTKYTRRSLLKNAGLGSLGLSFGPRVFGQSSSDDSREPHFFIEFVVNGGMDTSYLFDARPRVMTPAGMIQNYFPEGRKSFEWKGENGQSTWASPAMEVLKPHKDKFSVVNGIIMGTSFDGHGQNTNILLTGNPFGGDSFLPHLSNGDDIPVDFLLLGNLDAEISNGEASLPLTPELVTQLANASSGSRTGGTRDQILQRTYQASSQGGGLLSQGIERMAAGLRQASSIHSKLSQFNTTDLSSETGAVADLSVALSVFKAQLSSSAVINLDYFAFDTHDASSAAQQPSLYERLASTLSDLITKLEDTEFQDGKSFLDVTTFVLTSEFGRTMRQQWKSIGETGTDHNTLSNSMIVGGKGIANGHVFGASDLESVEAFNSPSEHHKKFDSNLLKVMGKPMDFETGSVMDPLSMNGKEFNLKQYLSIQSMTNTLLTLFGAQTENLWRTSSRDEESAPILRQLIKK